MNIKSLFKFVPAQDIESEDDMYELVSNPNWHIQVAVFHDGKPYVVGLLDDEGVTNYGEYRSLKQAMQKMIELASGA